MSMTQKENLLTVLNHQKGEWIPSMLADTISAGFGAAPGPWFEKGPLGGGKDGFGVNWVTPSSGGGAPIPAPNDFLLNAETVTDWKSIIHFPDVTDFDWEESAARELSMGNREIQAVDFGSGNGPFERLAAFMGFEEALIALALEPEACYDLMNAVIDYKLQVVDKVAKYYKPDTFTNYDDIATESSLFMSPEVYRKLIKPLHAKLNACVKSYGIIPIQHTCGHADCLVEDFIETGAAAWTSVQPSNDIQGILQKYGSKFCIIGGYDTNGEPGRPDASVEVMVREVRRDLDTYGKYPGYIFFGFKTVNSLDPMDSFKALSPIIQESVTYARQLAGY